MCLVEVEAGGFLPGVQPLPTTRARRRSALCSQVGPQSGYVLTRQRVCLSYAYQCNDTDRSSTCQQDDLYPAEGAIRLKSELGPGRCCSDPGLNRLQPDIDV